MGASFNEADVAGVIAQAEASGAILGVSAVSAAGKRVSHNGDRRFVAASTVKIAIMIELFRQADAGRLSLDTRHTLRPADKATGSGVVVNLHDGIELTLGDLAYLMMSISDNSSTNILIDWVGQERVNATMRDVGIWPVRHLDVGCAVARRSRGSRRTGPSQKTTPGPSAPCSTAVPHLPRPARRCCICSRRNRTTVGSRATCPWRTVHDRRLEPAVPIQCGLHERHSERASLNANGVEQALRIKGIQHELNAFRPAPLQGWQQLVDLKCLNCHDDQIIRDLLVKRAGNPHARLFTIQIDDRAITFKLL